MIVTGRQAIKLIKSRKGRKADEATQKTKAKLWALKFARGWFKQWTEKKDMWGNTINPPQ